MTQSLSPARSTARGQSFGKLILIGEHAVVYGAPAIALGITLGARASAQPAAGASSLELGDQRVLAHEAHETARAFAALLGELKREVDSAAGAQTGAELPKHVAVRVELDLPAGVGLGASAAIAVAIARACAGLAGLSEVAAVEAVLKAANAWESVFHETPSGVDVAAALAGAPIWFLRGQPPEHLSCGVPLQLAIALAGPPASTSRMVRGVRELRHAEPERVEALIADISTLAQAARQALAQGDLATLGAAMNSNHHALQQLGVSTADLDRACSLARGCGALGAKLTGAGGGGAVVALCQGSPDAVLTTWKTAGLQGFATQVAASGADASAIQARPGDTQNEDT